MIEKKRLVEGEFPKISKLDFSKLLEESFDNLLYGTGEGKEMTGWLFWPREYLVSSEYADLKSVAEEIRKNNDAIIVIGIGGSYLTTKMLVYSEYGENYNELLSKKDSPKVYFLGNDLSSDKINHTFELISGLDWSIIYISKSGGTMEPALSFRVCYEKLKEKYGIRAKNRIYSITDPNGGTLRNMSDKNEWKSFIIPPNIGGRYSGLTACGLLPSACLGLDTDKVLNGAIKAMRAEVNSEGFAGNYALWRYANYMLNGRKIEFLASNDPYLMYASEWLKQLFAESEGKSNKGIFPASGIFPTDLHSLGQFLQEGTRGLIFETFVERKFNNSIQIPKSDLSDNLRMREGKSFVQAAKAAMDGAYQAHSSGGNPCGVIRLENGLESMGYFIQSMFIGCAVYCYMLYVNPFNQPGVEKHKNEMKKSSAWDTLK